MQKGIFLKNKTDSPTGGLAATSIFIPHLLLTSTQITVSNETSAPNTTNRNKRSWTSTLVFLKKLILLSVFIVSFLTSIGQKKSPPLNPIEIKFLKWFLKNYHLEHGYEVFQKEAIQLSNLIDSNHLEQFSLFAKDSILIHSIISSADEFEFPRSWTRGLNVMSHQKIDQIDAHRRKIAYDSILTFFAVSRPIYFPADQSFWIYVQFNGKGDDGGTEVQIYERVNDHFLLVERNIIQIR